MDESVEADKHSTSVATSSNDESSGPSHQQAEPNYLDNWDDSKSASFTSTSFHCHDLDEHTSGSETSTLYHNTPQGHTQSDSDIINSDASKDSDTKDSETHDDAGSFGTVDSDDPIHEAYEQRIRAKHQAKTARAPKIHSPPTVTREAFSPPRHTTPTPHPNSLDASIAESARHASSQSPISKLTKLSPKHKPHNPPAPDDTTQTIWEVVAARGRKALDYRHKPTPPRSARKIAKARAPTKPIAPAREN